MNCSSILAVREQKHTALQSRQSSGYISGRISKSERLSIRCKKTKCFCQVHCIAKRKIATDNELDQTVESSMRQVNVIVLLRSISLLDALYFASIGQYSNPCLGDADAMQYLTTYV